MQRYGVVARMCPWGRGRLSYRSRNVPITNELFARVSLSSNSTQEAQCRAYFTEHGQRAPEASFSGAGVSAQYADYPFKSPSDRASVIRYSNPLRPQHITCEDARRGPHKALDNLWTTERRDCRYWFGNLDAKTRLRQPWLSRIVFKSTSPDHGRLPRDPHDRLRNRCPTDDILAIEIDAFYRWVIPKKEEILSMHRADESVMKIIGAEDYITAVTPHGSRSTNLALPTSDIDICISTSQEEIDAATSKVQFQALRFRTLKKLQQSLFASGLYRNVEMWRAEHPVVTATDKKSGLTYQIVCNAPVECVRDFTVWLQLKYPDSTMLFFVVRQILSAGKLNKTVSGGMGSYGLFIMLCTALAHYGPSPVSLGTQLKRFLAFWADADIENKAYACDPYATSSKKSSSSTTGHPQDLRFDALDGKEHDADGVTMTRLAGFSQPFEPSPSTRDPYAYGLHRIGRASPPSYLALQDPANPLNDLGAKCTRMAEIQALFRKVHAHLVAQSAACDRLRASAPTGALGAPDSTATAQRPRSFLEDVLGVPGTDDGGWSYFIRQRYRLGWVMPRDVAMPYRPLEIAPGGVRRAEGRPVVGGETEK